MTAGVSLLGEADLHGLVDGRLEAVRRADVLRKLAASPADQALVEAWHEQNDLIRAAFRDVEHEALPVALDLAPPRLRCIEGDLDRPLAPIRAPLGEPTATRPKHGAATAVALLIVAIGLVGSWIMLDQGRDDEIAATASVSPATLTATADRTVAADGSAQFRVPDLTSAGWRLTGVAAQTGASVSLVLQYRDANDGRITLGLTRASEAAPVATVGKTIAWQRGGTAYALAGSLPTERLRDLALQLQNDTAHD